jgi:hypothetical protein
MVNNIYYSPESYGLKILGEADIAGSYEFDTLVVFQDAAGSLFYAHDAGSLFYAHDAGSLFYAHDAGSLFYAHDSGCSCPIPFDGISVKDLTPILSAEDFYSVAKAHKRYDYYSTLQESIFDPGSMNLWIKVKDYFRGQEAA